jgi:hypothetical protein
MDPVWVRSLRDQSVEAGVPFHFKLWGDLVQIEGTMERVGKKKAGRMLDGRTWDELPVPRSTESGAHSGSSAAPGQDRDEPRAPPEAGDGGR